MTSHASASRRDFLRYAGAAAASAVGAIAVHEVASGRVPRPSAVTGAAAAERAAVRVALLPPEPGQIALPVEPGSGAIVLNNFGGFSQSLGPCSHNGIDVFPTTSETRLLVACVDAVIEGQRFAGSSGAQGNAWILKDAKGISYRYHHIDEFLDGLEVGSTVQRGQPIATMGKTGNARSEHLHFEVRLDGSSGTAIDPIPLITFPIPLVDLGEPTGCRNAAHEH